MNIRSLLIGVLVSLMTISYAFADDNSCSAIVGVFKCTDVLSPNGFVLAISTYEQGGSRGFIIAGNKKKIQFLLDGKDYVQDDTTLILRQASGRCSQDALNILEQVTNRSNGSQYKITEVLQVRANSGKLIQLDIEKSQRENPLNPWSASAQEKFLCIRK